MKILSLFIMSLTLLAGTRFDSEIGVESIEVISIPITSRIHIDCQSSFEFVSDEGNFPRLNNRQCLSLVEAIRTGSSHHKLNQFRDFLYRFGRTECENRYQGTPRMVTRTENVNNTQVVFINLNSAEITYTRDCFVQQ